MILHPTVIGNLVGSSITTGMVVYAATYGLQILKHWNIESGAELQLILERKTYLISTFLAFAFGMQLISLFLFVFTADRLTPLFVGAMCAAGTLNVNAFGYPTLLLKILNFVLAGLWLVLNYADNQGYDYPLIKWKYGLLVVIAPFILLESIMEFAYFIGMKPNVITSCCGSLFSSENATGLGSEIAGFPPEPMMVIFYLALLLTLLSGLYAYLTKKTTYLYAILSVIMFVIAIASIISFISLYIYEIPTHHCPFCLVTRDYSFIGYVLYPLLFGAVVSGMGVGILNPFIECESLRLILPKIIRKSTLISFSCYSLFGLIVTYEIVFSNLIMRG